MEKNYLDITGEIYTGMWSYGEPFPNVRIEPLKKVEWVKYKIYAETFEGMNSQCGTYLETPAHLLGDASYPLSALPVKKLCEVSTVVLNVGDFTGTKSMPITAEMLKKAPAAGDICEGCAILICTSWGKKWKDNDYLSSGPYITAEAMHWLIGKKPFLLGSDFARWDNLSKPQGFWQDFYGADILMLAPCVNLEKAPPVCSLTVLPINVAETCCAPCRAVLSF